MMKDSLEEEGVKPSKRLRPSASSGGLTDRISDLPHCIVQHILSFLPTKDAIKFCTLSRQWDSLWKSIPSLSFNCVSSERQEIIQFVSFVDKTLTAYASSKISKFLLEVFHYYEIEEKFESWIRFVKSRAVEELCIRFKNIPYDCKKNGVLHANCSAMKMSLTSVYFYYCSGLSFHWTALKVLSLADTTLESGIVRLVLLGSPLIEFLAIRKCEFTKNYMSDRCVIDASCASLKELVIDSCAIFHGPFEITAPNLLSLTVVGRMVTKTLKLVDVSSLEEATIDFSLDHPCSYGKAKYLGWHKRVQKSVLHRLRHVNKFSVGTRSLKLVSIRSVEGAFFGKSRRKILNLTMKVNKAYVPGIASLLKSSPDLEQLAIKIIPTVDADFMGLPENDDFAEETYWRSEMRKAKSLFRNLKIVDIVGFIHASASNLGKAMVELAQFILAKAMVLQKLIIHAEATNAHNKSWTSQPELDEIFEKLLCCPRASPNAVVILKN